MFKTGKVEVRQTERGRSIFATEEIKKNELIFIYGGKTITEPNKFTVQIGDNAHIQGSGDINDYINHSCEPNTSFASESLHLKSLRDIKKDEELFFNYNTSEWDGADPFECSCGSKNCVKIIKGFKHLSAENKNNIEPMLLPYLKNKMIDEIKKVG